MFPEFVPYNRLEGQVLDTFCSHLRFQGVPKKHPKDIQKTPQNPFFRFECYDFDFAGETWAIDTIVFGCVGLEDFEF